MTPVHPTSMRTASTESQVDLAEPTPSFNTCVLVGGETGSGKSYTVGGESGSRPGIVTLIIDHLYSKLNEDNNKYLYDTKVNRHSAVVSLQMYEVYNEMTKDLLQVPGMGTSYAELDETASKGVYVRNGTQVPVSNPSDGVSIFRQGWARRTESSNDYGPAPTHSAVVTYIDLELHVGENPQPNKSRFTVVELPGLEKLVAEGSSLMARDGPLLNRGLTSLDRVINSLSSNASPSRVVNYSDSKLTQLLQDEIGGNSKTKAIICLRSHTNQDTLTAILSFSSHLAQVKNFPILNDSFAQNLLTQHRARIILLQHQLGVGSLHSTTADVGDARDELRRLQTENLQLRDQLESLRLKLDQITGKFGNLATTKTDLSQQLLMSEEEKLKVSQTLVEMQIENNRLKEDAESTKFELTNKILTLENDLMDAEMNRDKHSKANRNASERLDELEHDRKDLADEYVVLKTNYLALTKEHETEVSRNEELCMELLNLVNAKATLMKQLEVAEKMNYRLGDPDAELDRVRTIVGRYNSRKAEDIHASQREREDMEQLLFGNQRRFDGEMGRVKDQYEDNTRKLEAKIAALTASLQDTRHLARDRQQKVSELSAKLITLRNEKEHLETLYNRVQHKVKDTNEEYRTRLIKYVEDIAEYMDKSRPPQSRKDSQMREFVDSMLKDMRKAFKNREEQLSQAVQQFKMRLQDVVRKHEELIVAYRNLQFRSREKGLDKDDLGPDDQAFQLSDSAFQTAQQQEIRRLKDELNSALNEVDTLRLRVSLGDQLDDSLPTKDRPPMKNDEKWSSLRKQLREFTLNTQQQLEKERADLLSKNVLLEEQLKESQSYIDSHLVRYKEEIIRLRRRLGEDDGRVISPAPLSSRYVGKNRGRPLP